MMKRLVLVLFALLIVQAGNVHAASVLADSPVVTASEPAPRTTRLLLMGIILIGLVVIQLRRTQDTISAAIPLREGEQY